MTHCSSYEHSSKSSPPSSPEVCHSLARAECLLGKSSRGTRCQHTGLSGCVQPAAERAGAIRDASSARIAHILGSTAWPRRLHLLSRAGAFQPSDVSGQTALPYTPPYWTLDSGHATGIINPHCLTSLSLVLHVNTEGEVREKRF